MSDRLKPKKEMEKPIEKSMIINFLVDPKTGIAFKLKCVKERKKISVVLREAVDQFLIK